MGFGAHLDARIALLRAVTELNQMLVWVLRDTTEAAVSPEVFENADTGIWLKTATTVNQPYLVPDETTAPRTPAAYPKQWTDDLKDDVLLCQEMIERRNMEMLVLDQTRLDVDLPVVKVIVPGLRHFWPRFGPGRLYEVPVSLGWLRQAQTEDQLNPVPIFF